MKKVEAILSPAKLEEVRELLVRVGVEGMTVSEVRGFGREPEHTEVYRGAEHAVYGLQQVKVEIVLEDGRVPGLVEELLRATRSGRMGDGKIFILNVEDAVRIRTSERSRDAL